jgi:hypothetical protein
VQGNIEYIYSQLFSNNLIIFLNGAYPSRNFLFSSLREMTRGHGSLPEKRSLPSVKCFAEFFLGTRQDTRQRHSLPSDFFRHSAKIIFKSYFEVVN